MEFLFTEPETHKRGSFHTHSLGKIAHVPNLTDNDCHELIEFWAKRNSANVPFLDETDKRLGYGYKCSVFDLEEHPCSKRMNINGDENETIKDLHNVVRSTQLLSCGSYCEHKNKNQKQQQTQLPI